jgi:uncharacterized protein (DUF433 family)
MLTEVIEPVRPGAPDPDRPSWIRKTPGVCGGDACIRNTRIPVWLLEGYRQLGVAEAGLLDAYPSLTSEDLRIAWAYVAAYRDEIEETIRLKDEE